MSLETFISPFLDLLVLENLWGRDFGYKICPYDVHDLGR
jgi:hypothetical protein